METFEEWFENNCEGVRQGSWGRAAWDHQAEKIVKLQEKLNLESKSATNWHTELQKAKIAIQELEFTKGQTELLAKVTIEIRETQKKLRHAEKIIRSYYFGVLNKEMLDNLVQKHFEKDINES
jgi:hypothetical protein